MTLEGGLFFASLIVLLVGADKIRRCPGKPMSCVPDIRNHRNTPDYQRCSWSPYVSGHYLLMSQVCLKDAGLEAG